VQVPAIGIRVDFSSSVTWQPRYRASGELLPDLGLPNIIVMFTGCRVFNTRLGCRVNPDIG
jgi:hypothetical protein